MTLYEKAVRIAVAAHKEQVRKTDNSPYIVHPLTVGWVLAEAGFSETVVAAGVAHDVLEDSDMTEAVLRRELGDEVVDIVTAVSEDTDLAWEERKEQYVQAVAAACDEVKAVSVADKIHNAESLIAYHAEVGSKAWEVFNRGKAQKMWFETSLHSAVSTHWQHPLLDRYGELIAALLQLED